jgi:heme exporter protein C
MATTPAASRADAAARPAIRGLWWKLGTGLWMSLMVLAVYLVVGPASALPYPEGGKTIFFHVPCAWLACLAYVVAAWYAVRYLRGLREHGGRALDDLKCAAAMEVGLLFSIVTTITGSIFSKLEWTAYWSWDPRQTSILIILLIFAAYLVLRGAISDPQTRARLSSVYALVALVPGLFLIWVLPRIVLTLHSDANRAVVGGGLGGNYRLVLYGLALPAFLGLFTWLFQLRVRALKLETRRESIL